MTPEEKRKRFTVITNNTTSEINRDNKPKAMYQTNPLREDFINFAKGKADKKFKVEDLLKW